MRSANSKTAALPRVYIGGGGFFFGGSTIIARVLPVYPEVARRAGLEGTVFLKFAVGADGRVKDVSVLSGPEIFREAATIALSGLVFKPAIQNDRPVAVWMTMPIRFTLGANQ